MTKIKLMKCMTLQQIENLVVQEVYKLDSSIFEETVIVPNAFNYDN